VTPNTLRAKHGRNDIRAATENAFVATPTGFPFQGAHVAYFFNIELTEHARRIFHAQQLEARASVSVASPALLPATGDEVQFAEANEAVFVVIKRRFTIDSGPGRDIVVTVWLDAPESPGMRSVGDARR